MGAGCLGIKVPVTSGQWMSIRKKRLCEFRGTNEALAELGDQRFRGIREIAGTKKPRSMARLSKRRLNESA